jgi:predicted RNA-binding Zn ribbon-like protein
MNAHFVAPVTSQPTMQSDVTALPHRESSDWRVQAVAAYASTTGETRTRLRRQLAERLLALTGCIAPKEALVANATGRSASAVVDSARFLLRGDAVTLVRPCAHCGTGRFVSEPLERQEDLGYALAVWAPYHRDCEPEDPPDGVSW